MVSKGIIYYSDCLLPKPILKASQSTILSAKLPIVSCTLGPMDFGENEVLDCERCYPTMVKQIVNCLQRSTVDYVFFCEHDILYPECHFQFTPPKDNIFYYNDNVYRWYFGSFTAITYDRLISLSGLCVNREFALSHYLDRLDFINLAGFSYEDGEPDWVRKMGYEPGTKKIKRGGFSDDDFETWHSEKPIIDIRHKGTFSPPKTKLSEFKHLPKNFKEVSIEETGWNLKEVFGCS